MTMLQVHAAAIAAKIASYHEFLARYSMSKSVVYGFVEGREDPCYYKGFIDHALPSGWEVELWAAGNRDQVFRVHAAMDWCRFSKKRVCFFVDRDLSGVIPEVLVADSNIYVTDGYSIENAIVNKETCRRVLSEVCGLGGLDHGHLDAVCDLFDAECEKFLVAMIPTMAWIIHWRRSGVRASLNDISMKDMFTVVSGLLVAVASPKGKASAVQYIHEQCNVVYDASVPIGRVEAEFLSGGGYRNLTRGKYVFWFLIEFCLSIRSDVKSHFKGCSVVPPMRVSLGPGNAMILVGSRAREPSSLCGFLRSNYISYICS